MFGNILSSLKTQDAKTTPTRRRYSRRSCDKCVTVIGSKMYPVVDWSIGGLQISGDEKMFAMNDEHDVVLKFQMRDDIMEVPHKARVVRKNRSRVAFEFTPLTKETRERFQSVVDDHVARQFTESQMI